MKGWLTTSTTICGLVFMAGAYLAVSPDEQTEAPPPATQQDTAQDESLMLAREIVGVVSGFPDHTHLIAALFPGGAAEIVMVIDPGAVTESEIAAAISAAMARGANHFQLLQVPIQTDRVAGN